jgi:hypothetical protein
MNDFDGKQPLEDPRQEAVAQFFATPEKLRKFRSVTALAEHLEVSRMTIYRWHDDEKVQQRIMRLVREGMRFGNYLMGREWPLIARAQIAAALSGSTQAATFCEKRAWGGFTLDLCDKGMGDLGISSACLEADEEKAKSDEERLEEKTDKECPE